MQKKKKWIKLMIVFCMAVFFSILWLPPWMDDTVITAAREKNISPEEAASQAENFTGDSSNTAVRKKIQPATKNIQQKEAEQSHTGKLLQTVAESMADNVQQQDILFLTGEILETEMKLSQGGTEGRVQTETVSQSQPEQEDRPHEGTEGQPWPEQADQPHGGTVSQSQPEQADQPHGGTEGQSQPEQEDHSQGGTEGQLQQEQADHPRPEQENQPQEDTEGQPRPEPETQTQPGAENQPQPESAVQDQPEQEEENITEDSQTEADPQADEKPDQNMEETEPETSDEVKVIGGGLGKEEVIPGGSYTKRSLMRSNGSIVVLDGGDYSSSGLKQHLKYIKSDESDPDSGTGKWRMVYCLDDTLPTPNGEISWDTAGRMRKEIVYCTAYGVRYWGEEAAWPAYRTGLGWKADYVATSYAIHIFNGEYTLEEIKEKAEGGMYTAIERMVTAARKDSNYSEFDSAEMREFKPSGLSYSINPETQGEWTPCVENGTEGYRTKQLYIPTTGEARNVSSVNIEFAGESHGASIVKAANDSLQVGADSNAAAFYLFMPKDAYLREAASGGCTINVQVSGKQAVYYSNWVYDPPVEGFQRVTFLEASYGGAQVIGNAGADIPVLSGRVQVNKTDRDTGGGISDAEFILYEWSNSRQEWKQHSVLSYINQSGKYISDTLTGTADNAGRFKVEESKSGRGYLNEHWSQEFNLSDSVEGFVSFNVTNQHYKGNLIISKKDSRTGGSLEGAVFTLSEWNNGQGKFAEIGTLLYDGEKKVYTAEGIHYKASNGGRFKVEETGAPRGYKNDRWSAEFFLDLSSENASQDFSYEVKNDIYEGSIYISKKDSETGGLLQGAVFTVYEWNSSLGRYDALGSLEYDRDSGYYKKEGILYKSSNEGKFKVEETSPPKGYVKSSWAAEFSLDLSSGTSSQKFSYNVKNEVYKGSIVIEKTDSEDGTDLTGAEFTLYEWNKEKNSYEKYGLLEYDAAAKRYKKLGMRWTASNEGRFKAVETKAPKGYVNGGWNQEFTISVTGNTVTQTFSYKVENVRQKGIIRLQKKDGESDGAAQGQASLEGAIYQIYKKDSYTAGDHEGSASYAGKIITDKVGRGSSEELELGDYYVIEKTASEGFLVDGHAYTVQLKEQNQSERVFYADLGVAEQIIRGDILIYKFGEAQDQEQEIQKPLEGIEFKITSQSTGRSVTIRTDKWGKAETKGTDGKGALVYDTYLIEEMNTPEGFKAIEPFKVKVEEENRLYTYVIENKRILGAVQIVKKDMESGRIIPVAGAEFKIFDSEGKQVVMKLHYPNEQVLDTFVTDENGQVLLPEKLTAGKYTLAEINAPEGYLLNGEEISFLVEEGGLYEKPITVAFFDMPAKGRIVINKTGKNTGFPIEGVTFNIYAAEDIFTPDGTLRLSKGILADTMITDEKGRAFGKELYLGTYEIVETQSAEGYLPCDDPHEVKLEYTGQEMEVTQSNVQIQNEEIDARVKIAKLADRTEGASLKDGRYEGNKEAGTYQGAETVNYTITITNSGNISVSDLEIEDEPSDELLPYIEEESAGFAVRKGQVLYTKGGDKVVVRHVEKNKISIDRLEPGDSVEVHFAFRLKDETDKRQELDNLSRVFGKYDDHGVDKQVPEDEDDWDNDKINLDIPETEPDTEPETETATEPETEPTETEQETEPITEPVTEPEPETETESEQEPETEQETRQTTEQETEPKPETEPGPETEPETQPLTEPQETETKVQSTESETDPPAAESEKETGKKETEMPPGTPPKTGGTISSPVKTNDSAAGQALKMVFLLTISLAGICFILWRRLQKKRGRKRRKQ